MHKNTPRVVDNIYTKFRHNASELGLSFVFPGVMRNPENPSKASESILLKNEFNRSAAYIRLLSSLLKEPPELVAIALRAEPPVLAALTAESPKAA